MDQVRFGRLLEIILRSFLPNAARHKAFPLRRARWTYFDRVSAFLGCLALLGLAACGNPDASSGKRESLTIAEAGQPAFALLYVADAKGYLKEAGLDVTFQTFALGRDALNSVLEGKADVATVFETPVVMRIYEGKDLVVLSTLHTSSRNQVILARRDRGIAKPTDLRAKKIGVTGGATTEYVLASFLATEGIAASSIAAVNVEPPDYEKALTEGTIDALVTFSPHTFELRRKLGDQVVTFYNSAYFEASMLVGNRALLTTKPEAATRLLKAIVRAQDFVERNKEESIGIVVARLAGRAQEATIRESWDVIHAEAKLDQALLSIMNLEAKWLYDSGRVSGPIPDFSRAMATDALRRVRPKSVTLPADLPLR